MTQDPEYARVVTRVTELEQKRVELQWALDEERQLRVALEAENTRLKTQNSDLLARLVGGCICRFEEDGETPVTICNAHAAWRQRAEAAEAVVAAKDEALKDARTTLEGWGAYIDEHTLLRHDFVGDVARIAAAVGSTPADMAEWVKKERVVIEAARKIPEEYDEWDRTMLDALKNKKAVGSWPRDRFETWIDNLRCALRALDGEKG